MGKIKNHFEKNKQLYIGIGVGVGVSAAFGAVVVINKGDISNVNNIKQMFAYKSTMNVAIEQVVRRGHPGFVVRCKETGEVFASIKRASELLQVSRTGIQRQLAGKAGAVGGYTFELLGEATA